MAALLGWQQKWSASGLSWGASWSDGLAVGDLELDSVGHSTLAQTGLSILIRKDLGDLELDSRGLSALSGNVTNLLPESVNLGNVSVASRGLSTVTTTGFDTVDPYWIDAPLQLAAVAHTAFPGTVGIQFVLAKSLGAVTLAAVGRSTLGSVTNAFSVRKDLGALTLQSIGGVSMTASVEPRTAEPTLLGDLTLAAFGRSTVSSVNLAASLPPHEIGPATMDSVGRSTVSALSLFSGGPFEIGAATVAAVGRSLVGAGISYPGFDEEYEIRAEIDPTVTTIRAEVEPEGVSVQ